MLCGVLFAVSLSAQAPPNAQHSDTITVTATRTPSRLGDTAASVVVVDRESLAATAAVTVDDALRQVPGFTLFRRSGSRVANPTSQGVSLRGVGASGASRALVLDDGIPLNDPFGGWVYWGRIPRVALDRVEVLRGGASDLYGSAALSGVIQFIRRDASRPALVADGAAGSQETSTLSLFAGETFGRWSGSLAADFFSTEGHILVAPAQRGLVDRPAGSRHGAVDLTVTRRLGEGRLFLRAMEYQESRNNGTPLQTNDTRTRQIAFGADGSVFGGTLLARAHASAQDYEQTFSAVATDRASERLTVDQRVPSRSAGGSLQWSRARRSHVILAGGEVREVSGASDELQFGARATTRVRSEGRQRIFAVFVQDIFAFSPRTSASASLRFDLWRNFDASRLSGPPAPSPAFERLVDGDETSWSPRLSIIHRTTERLSVTASTYRAFRAPTLNELYRGFRVGNIVTNANEELRAERLTAIEGGARLESARASLRATLFHMITSDVIANVTLSSTPALITRQRQNAGESRSQGLELEGEWRPAPRLRLSAGYLNADARVTSGSLSGRRLPQVPRNQVTLQAIYSAGPLTAGLQSRWSAPQFDDDLNQLSLRSYAVADVFAAYQLGNRVSLTLGGENLFDEAIEASATPVITYGAPRAWRVGFRFER